MTGRPPWRDLALARMTRRLAAGLSRETVAARVGIDARRLASYENGRNKPSDAEARAWDAALWRAVD